MIGKLLLVVALSVINVVAAAEVSDFHNPSYGNGKEGQSVIIMHLEPDVSEEDAIDAVVSKAAELNLAVVDVHRAPYVTTIEICSPTAAKQILAYDPTLAIYIPCRISLINRMLMTQNLTHVLESLPTDLQRIGLGVVQRINMIMQAAVSGEF